MTISPAQWIHTIQQSPASARAFVAEQVRLLLTAQPVRDMGTKELCETLWPANHAIGEAIELRKRMVDIVLKCARQELADCCRQGEAKPRGFMGKTARPWLWSTPDKAPAAAPSAQEVRQHVGEAIRFTPAGQMMPQAQVAQIVEVLMRRFKIVMVVP